jgi:plastocyanin
MTRLAALTALYALFAALTVAAPLSASQEAPPAGSPRALAAEDGAGRPGAPAPDANAAPAPDAGEATPDRGETALDPAEPAPAASAEPAPASPVPGEAAPAPAPAPGDPAATGPAAPASLRPDPARAARARDKTGAGRPKAVAAASATVTIRDFEFAPAQVTIDVGDTVTWTNEGPTAHSATAEDGSFDTGVYGEGRSRSHTFDQAGTFSYICTPHPFMKGTVTVRAASGGDAGSDGGADSGSGAGAGGGASGSQGDSGAALPPTGRDSGSLGLLGLATLALGVYLFRRTSPG